MQHIARLALVAGAFAALMAATAFAGMPKTAPPRSLSILLVNGPRMGGGFRGGGGGLGGAALGGAVGGLLGAMMSQPQQAPPPLSYASPPYQPQEAPSPYYAPALPPPPPLQYVDQPPPAPAPAPDTYVTVPPLGTPVSISRTRQPTISPQRAAPPDDPATAWSDPGQIIQLLGFPSGPPPILLPPPSGPPGPSPLDPPWARNPATLQATIDASNANLANSVAEIMETLASAADWIGWVAQTGLTYVPGMTPVNTGLTAGRGFASNFGKGLADPNATWGQAFGRGVGGATVSTVTSLAIPGVGKAASDNLPTLNGVATNTMKRLISSGAGKLYGASVKETSQQTSQ